MTYNVIEYIPNNTWLKWRDKDGDLHVGRVVGGNPYRAEDLIVVDLGSTGNPVVIRYDQIEWEKSGLNPDDFIEYEVDMVGVIRFENMGGQKLEYAHYLNTHNLKEGDLVKWDSGNLYRVYWVKEVDRHTFEENIHDTYIEEVYRKD